MKTAGRDASQVIDGCASFIAPAKWSKTIHFPTVNLNEIIEQAEPLHAAEVESNRRWRADIPFLTTSLLAKVPPVLGNAAAPPPPPPELREVATNLIYNAVERMGPEGGAITPSHQFERQCRLFWK
jgi:signal transduction histidine kinase